MRRKKGPSLAGQIPQKPAITQKRNTPVCSTEVLQLELMTEIRTGVLILTNYEKPFKYKENPMDRMCNEHDNIISTCLWNLREDNMGFCIS